MNNAIEAYTFETIAKLKERVEELEKLTQGQSAWMGQQAKDSQKRIAQLEQALGFYADREHYRAIGGTGVIPVAQDHGEMARDALREIIKQALTPSKEDAK